jgi:hypothetical protein
MNKKKPQLPAKPFFTRFLEKQHLEEASGGRPPINTTDKFPSDNDEQGV